MADGDTDTPTRLLALFVHGLGGKALATWKDHHHPDFAALAKANLAIDAEYFSYPTILLRLPFISRAAPRIQVLAAGLRTVINNRYSAHDRIVLVCHSLGGLVARWYILEEIKAHRPLRVRHIVLFAVPNTGSALANIANYISWRHSQLRQLCKESDLLDILNRDWGALKAAEHVPATYVIGGVDRVVTAESASLMPGNPHVEVVVDRGHIALVKPTGSDDLSFLILKAIIERLPPHTANTKGREGEGDAALAARLYQESLAKYAESSFHESLSLIRRAHGLHPTDTQILRQYVRVCFAQRDHDAVSELLNASTSRFSRDVLSNHWGEFYIRTNQPARAVALLTPIESRSEYNVEYHTGVAYLNLYYSDGDPLNLVYANDHLARGEQHYPDHWWIKVNLLLVHRLLKQAGVAVSETVDQVRVQQTLPLLEAALEHEPCLFSARIYRLLYYAIVGDHDSFVQVAAKDATLFRTQRLEVPKNFPRSLMDRLRTLFRNSPQDFEYYKSAILATFTR